MDVEDVLAELNLDETDENKKTIKSILEQAEQIIANSVDQNVKLTDLEKNKIFQRAVITLTTDLYYNRTLPDGLSLGVQMMINTLKGVDFNAKQETATKTKN